MKHTLWIKITGILQFITAALHSVSLFVPPQPQNDAEKQMLDLMQAKTMDNMMGSTTSVFNLMTSMSVAFTLIYIFGGALNWYLVKKADIHVLKEVTTMQIVIFGILFAVCAWITFLPPVVCTGLVFVALLIARLTFPKEREPYK